jgi:hypothetical protein
MSETATSPNNQGEIIGRMKARIKDLSRRLQAAEAASQAATTEAAAAKAKYETEPLKAENEQLRGEIRTGKHKAAFSRLAKDAGVREKAVEALYQLSGWKAEKDDVDEKGMSEAIEGLRESADYAFEPAQDAQAETKPEALTPSRVPPPAQGRGAAHQPSRSGVVLTRAQMADPRFMLNPANREIIQSAAKEHRFQTLHGDQRR